MFLTRNVAAIRKSVRSTVAVQLFRFSTSPLRCANRAIVYTKQGNPAEVLSAVTYPTLPPPPENSLNVKFILSPINPADVNVIEGVYPSKPQPTSSFCEGHHLEQPVFVGGNEGLAEVLETGEGVKGLQKGDWVVMAKQQAGTWASARTVNAEDVIKVPGSLSEVNGATISVNPPTAYNMLHNFVPLRAGDWLIQNGANSAVGQAVIQIAARKGLKTINFVRNRENLDALRQQLSDLGATHVLTYDDLADKSLRDRVKEWTQGKQIQLMLNCVSGEPTTHMARLLGSDAQLVSYGAMSKQPLSLPTSLFIFKNLVARGFSITSSWQSRWYKEKGKKEREELLKTIAHMKLKEPEHEIVTLPSSATDADISREVQSIFAKMAAGEYRKKVLLKLEEPED